MRASRQVRVDINAMRRPRVRTRRIKRTLPSGAKIVFILKKRSVYVEGTINGVDCFSVKLERKRGWRDRFQALIDKALNQGKKIT